MGVTRGFVLAGGLSTRFGSDKAVADLDGQPAVVTLARRLQAAGLEAAVVARSARNLGLREVIEPACASRHPLLGIAAIDGDDDVFACSCDAVDLTVAAISRLCAARAVSRDSPLCGVWPAALRRRAAQAAKDGRSVRWLAAGLPVLDVGIVGNRNEPGSARADPHGEHAAHSDGAPDVELAAVCERDAAGDREAEPGALVPRRVEGDK